MATAETSLWSTRRQHVLTVGSHVACFLEGRIALQGRPSELTNDQITAAYFGV
jgi:hypothetical protein